MKTIKEKIIFVSVVIILSPLITALLPYIMAKEIYSRRQK